MSQAKVNTADIVASAVTDAKVATGIDAAKLANGSVSNTEFQYLDGVTSAIQTQLNGKAGAFSVVSVNSNITMAVSTIYFVDTTSARSLKMPAPASGAIFWVKEVSFKAQTNNITFTRNASEKIEGVSASYVMAANGGAMQWVSDGTDWYLMS